MTSFLHQTLPLKAGAFEVFASFKHQPHVFFLDSALTADTPGRFSFIGFSPFCIVEGNTLEDFERLRRTFNDFQFPLEKEQPHPLAAGMVGYISYDFGRLLQGLAPMPKGAEGFFFGFYDRIICVDHAAKKIHITSTGFPESDPPKRRARAQERMDEALHLLASTPPLSPAPALPALKFQTNFTQAQYVQAVQQALAHIREGDIYQINLSRQIYASCHDVDALAVYAALRRISPSDHSAYFTDGKNHILSSSPERCVALTGRQVQVKPMKGTRPRGTSPSEDSRYCQELTDSPKEIAELLMVTDLERNDLGRVCEYGSVRVASMRAIETYATVFQATSTIEGVLRPDCDGFDILKACFPSGSVTGCPKIEAMKTIDRLETVPRGLYTGALGYMSFTGGMDFNVLIRTLILGPQGISFHVGGGIVADSDPVMEYEETCLKAKAMERAVSP